MFVSIVQTLIKLLGGLFTSTLGGKCAEEIQSPWANACYTFYEAFLAEPLYDKENIFGLIRGWAQERGLYDKGDSKTQYIKLIEESGELAQAILKNDEPEVIDAIGDMVVVLTNLAKLRGYNIEDCIQSAYDEISNRKGKMVNGTFVKNTLWETK